MEKVRDSFQTMMEESIIKLDADDREGKFNRFMTTLFVCIFLCFSISAIIYL